MMYFRRSYSSYWNAVRRSHYFRYVKNVSLYNPDSLGAVRAAGLSGSLQDSLITYKNTI